MTTENRPTELERTQRQLIEMQRLARLGSWEFDVPANRVTWTDGLYEIYGLDRSSFRATYEGYLDRLHPDDRDQVQATIGEALARGGSFEFEERIIRPDGEVRTLLSVGRVIRDGSGAWAMSVGLGYGSVWVWLWTTPTISQPRPSASRSARIARAWARNSSAISASAGVQRARTVEEQQGRAEPRPATGGAQEDVQRPWWRRVFGD